LPVVLLPVNYLAILVGLSLEFAALSGGYHTIRLGSRFHCYQFGLAFVQAVGFLGSELP
jgi:hypothetical protein